MKKEKKLVKLVILINLVELLTICREPSKIILSQTVHFLNLNQESAIVSESGLVASLEILCEAKGESGRLGWRGLVGLVEGADHWGSDSQLHCQVKILQSSLSSGGGFDCEKDGGRPDKRGGGQDGGDPRTVGQVS